MSEGGDGGQGGGQDIERLLREAKEKAEQARAAQQVDLGSQGGSQVDLMRSLGLDDEIPAADDKPNAADESSDRSESHVPAAGVEDGRTDVYVAEPDSEDVTPRATESKVDDDRNFQEWVKAAKQRALITIAEYLPEGASPHEIAQVIRDVVLAHRNILTTDEFRRNPDLLQKSAIALATYVEENFVPRVDDISKMAVLALFTRYKMPPTLALPLAEFAGRLIGRKLNDPLLNLTQLIRAEAIRLKEDSTTQDQRTFLDKVLGVITEIQKHDAVPNAVEGDSGEDTVTPLEPLSPLTSAPHAQPEGHEDGFIEGEFREIPEEDEEPDGSSSPPPGSSPPPAPPPPPTPPPPPGTPGAAADPENPDGVKATESDTPDRIPVAVELIKTPPPGGELPKADNYFMEKHRVNSEINQRMAEYNHAARQSLLVFPPDHRAGLTALEMTKMGLVDVGTPPVTLIRPESETIRIMAMNRVALDKGRPVRFLDDDGAPVYYIEYDSRDWTQCREFGMSGSEASIIVRLTRAGLTSNYSQDELMVLRTLDNRSHQFMMETYFEQYFLMKLAANRIDADDENPLTVDPDQLQAIYEDYKTVLYKISNSLLASSTLGADDQESGKEDAQIFQLAQERMGDLRDRLKQRGFQANNVERYGLRTETAFRVDYVVKHVRSNPRAVDMHQGRPLDTGRDVMVAVRRRGSFDEVFRDEVLPTLDALRHTMTYAHAGRDRILSPESDIASIINIAKKVKSPEVVRALKTNPLVVMAMQEYMLCRAQVGAQCNRIPTERYGALDERTGMDEAEMLTLNALMLRRGPREGKLSESQMRDAAIRSIGIFQISQDENEDQLAYEARYKEEHKEWEESVRLKIQEIQVEEIRRDTRYFAESKSAVIVARGLQLVYAGEEWGYHVDAFEEALTAQKLVGHAPLPGEDDSRSWAQVRTFADDMSPLLGKLRKVLFIEAEQFGQEIGDAVIAIPVDRNIGSGNTDTLTHRDYYRVATLQRRARRNGASPELIEWHRRYQGVLALLKKPAGDIARLAGWRTNQVNQTITEDLSRESKTLPPGVGRTDFIIQGLQQYGGTRMVINYINDNVDGMMREEGSPEIAAYDAAKEALEIEYSQKGNAGRNTKREAHSALIALQEARDEAKIRYMSHYVFEGLLAEQPSLALSLEHRSLTPDNEATVRQHLVTYLAKRGVSSGDGSRTSISSRDMGVIMNGIMPQFELAARHIDRRLTELRRQPGGLSPEGEEAAVQAMEENIKAMFAEWVKSSGYAINPVTGEEDPSYRNIADVLGYSGSPNNHAAQADVLLEMFQGFRQELRRYVNDSSIRDRPLYERFGEGLALNLGSYDAQLTGHQFPYDEIEFNGSSVVDGSLGMLEKRSEIKQLYAGLFGDKGVIAQIYTSGKPFTEETIGEHSEALAKPIMDIVGKLTSNPLEAPILKAKLAVICVSALRGTFGQSNVGRIAGQVMGVPEELTIWDSKDGKDSNKKGNTADLNMRYHLLAALCIKLGIPREEFVVDLSVASGEADQRRAEAQSAAQGLGQVNPILGGLLTIAVSRASGPAGSGVKWNAINLPLVVKELGFSERIRQAERNADKVGTGLQKSIAWLNERLGGK